MKFLPLIHAFSKILAFFSIFPLINLGFSLAWGFEELFWREFLLVFFICILPSILYAIFRKVIKKPPLEEFTHREAIGVTVFSWFLFPLLSALPLMLSGAIPGYVDAIFEATSGLTTTGASILSDIEKIPQAILFWRSLLHFIGGAGIVLASVVLLPGLTSKVFQVEVFTPIGAHANPKIMEIGKRVWLVYCSLNGALVFLYLLGGMSLFDSLCHSFAAIGTGGFSPYNASFGYYASIGHPSALYFEVVTILFMFLGASPFLLIFELFRGNFREFLTDVQFKFYLSYTLLLTAIIVLNLVSSNVYPTLGENIRHGFFSLVSMSTTTGFGTQDFSSWPSLSRLILFLVMFVGGASTSTAGGIKILRFIYLFKLIVNTVRQQVHPQTVYPTKLGKLSINLEDGKAIVSMVVCFLAVYVSGILLLSIYEKDIIAVISVVISMMAGVGPGITQQVGPIGNYSAMEPEAKTILTMLMIMGRIEIIPIFTIFLRKFWLK